MSFKTLLSTSYEALLRIEDHKLRLRERTILTDYIHLQTMYQYDTLSDSKKELRLLAIDEHGSTELSYKICTFDFSQAPAFIALSYTWGSPKLIKSIKINGNKYNIRDNLYSALRALYDNGPPKEMSHPLEWLWIDAICINQNDVRERGKQVAMMGEYF